MFGRIGGHALDRVRALVHIVRLMTPTSGSLHALARETSGAACIQLGVGLNSNDADAVSRRPVSRSL